MAEWLVPDIFLAFSGIRWLQQQRQQRQPPSAVSRQPSAVRHQGSRPPGHQAARLPATEERGSGSGREG